jgi:hypothetical protein
MHVTLLAHERAQGIEFAGVTAIQRRQGRNGGKIHASIVIPAPCQLDSARCKGQACPHERTTLCKAPKTIFGFT